jgi:hypothetical protein
MKARINMSEHISRYSDAQKAKFAVEEAYVKTLQGRIVEPIIQARDYAFYAHPENYVKVCNKYFGGNVQVSN